MEQIISEIVSSSITVPQQTKEAETKKRPHLAVAESHPDHISLGNSICLEGTETVQSVQEAISPHESPSKKRHNCNSSDIATDCSLDEKSVSKESCSGDDASQSGVSDAYTQADGGSCTLRDGSLQICQTEKTEATDMEFEKQIVSTEDEHKPITEASCPLAGCLQQDGPAETILMSSTDATLVSGSEESMKGTATEHYLPKDGHPVNLSKESLCGENASRVHNVTDEVPALVSSESIQSAACCKEEKAFGRSSSLDQSYVCSEQRNVEVGGNRRKKLLILDVNGLLADIVANPARQYMPDAWISMKAVFKRPFCTDFLEFCFDNFEVGVWSSRNRKNVDSAVDFLMGDKKKKLLFCWDQGYCTDTGYTTVEDRNKPLFLKEIKKLWDKEDPNLPWEKGYYNESNTVLMDDSPHKALCNPPYTGVFPHPYEYRDIRDNLLARRGKLRLYLERLAKADDVQKFIAENRFGQRPITKTNISWAYYSKIFDAAGSSKPKTKGDDDAVEPKHVDKQEPPSEPSACKVEPPVAIANSPK